MTTLDSAAIAIQVLSCAFMSGVVAIIQLIHYPCFIQVDQNHFLNFHSRHIQALGIIAGPAMSAELISAIWLARSGDHFLILNLAAVVLLWILTFFISVPAHNKLATGFDEKAWRLLVRTNWPRTFLWFIRFFIFLIWLIILLESSK